MAERISRDVMLCKKSGFEYWAKRKWGWCAIHLFDRTDKSMGYASFWTLFSGIISMDWKKIWYWLFKREKRGVKWYG
jgi:hypothetical protein